MEASMHAWWRATGVSTVAQDGAESATPCANESHKHHHGLNDSIWQQYKAVRRTFHTYLTNPMRDREGRLRARSAGAASASASVSASASAAGGASMNTNTVMYKDGNPAPTVGFISGMPGSVMEAGEAKVPGGYDEMVFGLPRWTWIDNVRESVIASPLARDMGTSIGQRMFPLPLSAPYHPSMLDPRKPGAWTPVSGYETVGTLCEGSCEEHLPEIEWALSQMWGTGAFPQLRSTKLWDGPRSKALVLKLVAWAKRYRRVLSSEFVTLKHGTVCWGAGGVNVSAGGANEYGGGCTSTDLDAILHRAPKAYYPDIQERGFAMVFNPTNRTITTSLLAPLYYAGISKARGDVAVAVAQEGGVAKKVALGVNDTIALPVTLQPRKLTWFVVAEHQQAG